MKNYGNVKGRKYYNVQPEPKTPSGKQLCPRCRKPKPHKDFIGSDNLLKKSCKECRRKNREAKRRQNDTEDMR